MISLLSHKKKEKRGFTLIESIIVIAIFVSVFLLFTTMIFYLYKINDYGFNQAIAIDQAQFGIQTLVKEIRRARGGEDGSYAILKASDKEFIFHSDIDGDGNVEKVRYFLGSTNYKNIEEECITNEEGGSCQFIFSDFLEGDLISAKLRISVDGDLGREVENADIYINGNYFKTFCQNNCLDCANNLQDLSIFDITEEAKGNFIQVLLDASSEVKPICILEGQNYSMRVKAELLIEEEIEGGEILKKSVIKASSNLYLEENKKTYVITPYVAGDPPIFEYFDSNGAKIEDNPARLIETKGIKVLLIINADPKKNIKDFELESFVQIRNLKLKKKEI